MPCQPKNLLILVWHCSDTREILPVIYRSPVVTRKYHANSILFFSRLILGLTSAKDRAIFHHPPSVSGLSTILLLLLLFILISSFPLSPLVYDSIYSSILFISWASVTLTGKIDLAMKNSSPYVSFVRRGCV